MTTTFADLTDAELLLVTAYRRYAAPMWETNAFDDVEADLWELHRELGVGGDEWEDHASPAAAAFWHGEYRRLESARRATATTNQEGPR